jgi:hypothetical protein
MELREKRKERYQNGSESRREHITPRKVSRALSSLLATDEGWAGYELCINHGKVEECACRIIFWDAVGQYFLEMPNGELKVEYVLKLLAETVKAVKEPVHDCEHLFSTALK